MTWDYGGNITTWDKTTPLTQMVLDYSFQLPTDVQLKQVGTAERSINYRLGNLVTTAKNGQITNGANTFHSVPQLHRDGEAVYICSYSLSSHTGILPNGL